MIHPLLTPDQSKSLLKVEIEPDIITVPLMSAPQDPSQVSKWVTYAQDVLSSQFVPTTPPIGDILFLPLDCGPLITLWGWDFELENVVVVGPDFDTPIYHKAGYSNDVWITANPLRFLTLATKGHEVYGLPNRQALTALQHVDKSVKISVTERTLIHSLRSQNAGIKVIEKWNHDPINQFVTDDRHIRPVAPINEFWEWASSALSTGSDIGIKNWRGITVMYARPLREWMEREGYDMRRSLQTWWRQGWMSSSYAFKAVTVHQPGTSAKRKAYAFTPQNEEPHRFAG